MAELARAVSVRRDRAGERGEGQRSSTRCWPRSRKLLPAGAAALSATTRSPTATSASSPPSSSARRSSACSARKCPYATTVAIDQFEHEGALRRIHATVYVDRENQRAILLGAGGAQMKEIASQARADMERLFGGKVFLEVWVRVKRGWADDDASLDAVRVLTRMRDRRHGARAAAAAPRRPAGVRAARVPVPRDEPDRRGVHRRATAASRWSRAAPSGRARSCAACCRASSRCCCRGRAARAEDAAQGRVARRAAARRRLGAAVRLLPERAAAEAAAARGSAPAPVRELRDGARASSPAGARAGAGAAPLRARAARRARLRAAAHARRRHRRAGRSRGTVPLRVRPRAAARAAGTAARGCRVVRGATLLALADGRYRRRARRRPRRSA